MVENLLKYIPEVVLILFSCFCLIISQSNMFQVRFLSELWKKMIFVIITCKIMFGGYTPEVLCWHFFRRFWSILDNMIIKNWRVY